VGQVKATPSPVDDNHDSSPYIEDVVITISLACAILMYGSLSGSYSARELGAGEFDIGRCSCGQKF